MQPREDRADEGQRPYISVVIPVYRAEGVLPELFERLTTTLRTIERPYEIILVDDGSPDGSWPVVRDFAAASDNVTGVLLSRNFGQHQAISAGLDLAKGEWTVVMDCDLQDPPEDIPRLLHAAEGGFDVVLARRSARYGTPVKRVTSALFYRVFSVLSGYHMDQSVGTFRIMHRTVVDAVQSMPESPRLFGGLVRWVGFATGYVDVERAERPNRKSAYGWSQLIKLALDGIVAFSNRPLYISISIGITMSFLSAAYGLFLVINFLIDRRVGVPGWLSTMTLSAFIGGIVLLNLGIIGIYVGRIYEQTKRRPLYVIRSVSSPAPEPEARPVGRAQRTTSR